MVSATESIFGQRSRLEVLRCLYGSGEDLTGREIARRARFSHQQAHDALKELVSLGVVERRIAAPAHLFRLNREHWVVKEVAQVIFEREKEWLEELLRGISKGLPRSVESLILFGSAAQGKMRSGSDVDLLVLVDREADKPEAVEHFTKRSAEILARYHYPLAPVVLTVKEFRERYRAKNEFAREVLKTGRVVHGKLLTEIL